MAVINPKILNAAYADGFFDSPLSDDEKLYLHQSILTAWQIIQVIESSGIDGLELDQIAQRCQTHKNTIKIYCRWLRSKRLILSRQEQSSDTGRPRLIYYKEKHG